MPEWLTETALREKIHPKLRTVPLSTISSILGISRTYAFDIRARKPLPHPKHRIPLVTLAGLG
jgi:hypothetical protein